MNKDRIGTLPNNPGVYLFKDATNTIIYIGKASSLRQRVRSYFTPHSEDLKTLSIMRDCHTLNYIITKSELEAALLEADLIKRYQPKYNTLLKDGQPFLYLCFTQAPVTALLLVRNKKQKGSYFGPFLHKGHARAAYRYLMNTFKLSLCNKKIANGCLEYHLDICAGSCRLDFDQQAYRCRLELAKNALCKDQASFLKTLYDQIQVHADKLEFERAQHLQRYAQNIESIFSAISTKYLPEHFYDKIMIAAADSSTLMLDTCDSAQQLQNLLKTEKPIHTIDCFDISHFQSTSLVGSCIRFRDGKPDTALFRRFKLKTLTRQNDYAALQEIVSRRYKNIDEYPDLILIDGGKGQLSAIVPLVGSTPIASLAKREERLFSSEYPEGKLLTMHTESDKLLIALRDYAHHFAINYHRLLRSNLINTP